MAARIRNMTEGKPASLIFTFALPLMVGNVFQQLYTVVDTMVVGKALGVGALAALGAADWLNWMMLGIIQGFTQGFGILMAQEFGAGRYDNLRKSVGNSTVLALVSALALLITGQLLAHPVLSLLNTPPKILPDTLLYLRIMYLGVPIVMAYNLLASILRSLGDGKTPLHAMIVAAITNIALDLLFVLVFRFGIAGAAIATLIAQLISSLFCPRTPRDSRTLGWDTMSCSTTTGTGRELSEAWNTRRITAVRFYPSRELRSTAWRPSVSRFQK